MMPKGINVGFWVYECFVAVILNQYIEWDKCADLKRCRMNRKKSCIKKFVKGVAQKNAVVRAPLKLSESAIAIWSVIYDGFERFQTLSCPQEDILCFKHGLNKKRVPGFAYGFFPRC